MQPSFSFTPKGAFRLLLGVTALGNSISAAKLQAYKAVKCIRWEGAWCRKDISDKARRYESSSD